jgi:hypothetical protein
MAKRMGSKGGGRGTPARAGGSEYELHVRGGVNTIDERIEAELRSPALDPAMHPAGRPARQHQYRRQDQAQD